MMKYVLLTLAVALTGSTLGPINMSHAADDPAITFVDEGQVTPEGLYLTRAKFGRFINAKGATIQVYKGYIFVSWYRGGMDDRSMYLSRKKIGEGEWRHISFPHRHVMFRGDKDKPEAQRQGDAHNYIAIGICPRDDTIHLLYDMHAYSPKDFEDDYFNYRVSKKGAAIVPDDLWSIDLFRDKQNYLNSYVDRKEYYRVTYPGFWTTDEGNLMVKWRIGGTHNAYMHFSEYNGTWSRPRIWNDTNGQQKVGFYGGFTPIGGRLVARWTHRSNTLRSQGYPHGGQAVYAAYCNRLDGQDEWYDLAGNKYRLPIKDLEPFKVIESPQRGQLAKNGPMYVTPAGDIQMIFRLNNETTVATLGKNETKATIEQVDQTPMPGGRKLLIGSELFSINLENRQPVIRSTTFGTDHWKERYRFKGAMKFTHGQSVAYENSFYFYLQQVKPRNEDARPLHVFRFDLPEIE